MKARIRELEKMRICDPNNCMSDISQVHFKLYACIEYTLLRSHATIELPYQQVAALENNKHTTLSHEEAPPNPQIASTPFQKGNAARYLSENILMSSKLILAQPLHRGMSLSCVGMDLSVPTPMPCRKRNTTIPAFVIHIFQAVDKIGYAAEPEDTADSERPGTVHDG